MKDILSIFSTDIAKLIGLGFLATPILLICTLFIVSAIFMASYNSIMPYWTNVDKNNFNKITYWESVSAVVFLWIVGMLLFK